MKQITIVQSTHEKGLKETLKGFRGPSVREDRIIRIPPERGETRGDLTAYV